MAGQSGIEWTGLLCLEQLGGWPDKRGHGRALLDGRRWREMPHPAPMEAATGG